MGRAARRALNVAPANDGIIDGSQHADRRMPEQAAMPGGRLQGSKASSACTTAGLSQCMAPLTP